MKTWAELYPNASEAFRKLNPPSSPSLTNQNAVAGQQGGKKRASMNKTEAEFALILEAQKRKGEIRDWKYESIKLRLGDSCWYVPDFLIYRPAGEITFMEVKGFLRDDARVKFLAAREQHQWAEFEMWRKTKEGFKQIL